MLRNDYITPSQNLPSGLRVKNSDLPHGKKAVLFIVDSFGGKFTLGSPGRTVSFRYDSKSCPVWESDVNRPPLTIEVYKANDYLMVDRSDLIDPALDDVIVYYLSASGLGGVYGSGCAQCPTAADWKSIVYHAFNLDESFRFDAVYVCLGTNDLSALVNGRAKLTEQLKFPETIGDFIDKMDKHMERIAVAFDSVTVYVGCGFGSVPAAHIPPNPHSVPISTTKNNAESKKLMSQYLSLVNAAICDRAHLSYDSEGFARNRVMFFGFTPPPEPNMMTLPGTGHTSAPSFSYVAVAFRNIIELTLAKAKVFSRDRPLVLIKTVTDGLKWSDWDGNVHPHSHCGLWTQDELKKYPGILLKCSTNGQMPLLARATNFPLVKAVNSEVQSVPNLFRLGQLAALKPWANHFPHDPEEPVVVIDTYEETYAVVYHIAERRVVLAPHNQLHVPTFLAPKSKEEATIRSASLLERVEERVKAREQEVQASLAQAGAFPPLVPAHAAPQGSQSSLVDLSNNSSLDLSVDVEMNPVGNENASA